MRLVLVLLLLAFSGLVNGQQPSINLKKQKITSIPDSVFNHTEIEELDLSKNKLEELSIQIGTLQNLKILNLSNNNLTHLPDSICKLVNLKELIIYKNELVEIPICLNNLKKLEVIDAWANNISDPTNAIQELKKLKRAEFQVNPIKQEIQNQLIEILPNTKFSFSSDCGCR